jgi:hypothetical protein
MSPILELVIEEVPTLINFLKARYATTHPGEPPLTSEQVMAAFEDAFTSTIHKDEMIRAAHRI